MKLKGVDLKIYLEELPTSLRRSEQRFDTRGCTYSDLLQTTACIRRFLFQYRNSAAPVCLGSDNKCLVAAAMLAALTNGPPLVLPHALSQPVLKEMQAQTGCRLAIVDRQRDLPRNVEQFIPSVQQQDAAWHFEGQARDLDAPYAWLFTGGSTGRPQIWSKTIGNLWGEALNLARTFNVSEQDRILATVPPNHIYGLLFSVLLALVSGAQLVEATPSFPREIISAISDHQATILVSVPVHYLALKDCTLSGHRPRLAFSSGGMLDAAAGKAFSGGTGVPIVEVYGSTETGGIATRCRAKGEELFTPFPVVAWKTVDDFLAVKSSFLSKELARDAQGYFITGDRVRALSGGGIELLGRGDGIIKVGGKRVDLEHIRETLICRRDVRNAAVIPIKVGKGHETGIAALVAGDADVQVLKKALRSRLEPYECPRRIRVVERIPLTSAGKPDRPAIRALLS